MATSTDHARDEVIAARQGLLDEAEGLRRSAIQTVNLPARAREDPARFGALAAGGAFLVLGGPRRLISRVRRVLLGAPAPKSLLPREIERAVEGLGKDSGAVKAQLDREFAEYLEERKADRERSMVRGMLAGAAGTLVSTLSQRAARRLADEVLAPRDRSDVSNRDGRTPAEGGSASESASGGGRSRSARGWRRGR